MFIICFHHHHNDRPETDTSTYRHANYHHHQQQSPPPTPPPPPCIGSRPIVFIGCVSVCVCLSVYGEAGRVYCICLCCNARVVRAHVYVSNINQFDGAIFFSHACAPLRQQKLSFPTSSACVHGTRDAIFRDRSTHTHGRTCKHICAQHFSS